MILIGGGNHGSIQMDMFAIAQTGFEEAAILALRASLSARALSQLT
jgi:hypothetical protein